MEVEEKKARGSHQMCHRNGKKSISEAARRANDNQMIALTENNCLIAQEAQYHPSCRRDYTRSDARNANTNTTQIELQEGHNQAFEFISNYVQKEIIDNCNVERISMLKEKVAQY